MNELRSVPAVAELQYHGTPEKPDIKIFVSHRIDQDSETIDNPLYIPVRCGATYDKREGITMLGDDTGDNISEKRMSFCEFTIMYWAWKNVEADYYGLCHYRRYLSFTDRTFPGSSLKQGLLDSLSEENVRACGLLDVDNIRRDIAEHDIVVSNEYHMKNDCIPDSLCSNIRENWVYYCSSYLKEEHFDLLLELIQKHAPTLYQDAKSYMNGQHFRGFNCFILNKNLFFELCEFIFPILFEFDELIDKCNYSDTQNRAAGYAGEWLYSIWIYHSQKDNSLRIAEHQILAFQNTAKTLELSPAYTDRNIPVVFTANDTNRPFIAVCLQSIIQNASPHNNYDIIVLQRSFDEDKWGSTLKKEECSALSSMAKGHENITIRFFDPKDQIYTIECREFGEPSAEEQYYLLLGAWILNNYPTAIFIRESTILHTDIAQLLEYDLESFYAAAPKDVFFIAMINGFVPKFHENCQKALKIENFYDYVSTDITVLNLHRIRKKLNKIDLIAKLEEIKLENVTSDGFNLIFEKQILFLPQSWNKIHILDSHYFKMMEYVPSELSAGQQSANQPNLSLLRGVFNISLTPQTSIIRQFWHMANQTPFYEQLLLQSVPNLAGAVFDLQNRMGLFDTRSNARKFADKILPLNSRRRRLSKFLLPKGSLRWRFCKQVYYIFSPKARPIKSESNIMIP